MSGEHGPEIPDDNLEKQQAKSLVDELKAKYGDKPWLRNTLLAVFGPTLIMHEGVAKLDAKDTAKPKE